jgi:hypothetical protein
LRKKIQKNLKKKLEKNWTKKFDKKSSKNLFYRNRRISIITFGFIPSFTNKLVAIICDGHCNCNSFLIILVNIGLTIKKLVSNLI